MLQNYANLHHDDYNAAGFIFISTSVGNIVISVFLLLLLRRRICRLLFVYVRAVCMFFSCCYVARCRFVLKHV